METKEDEFVKKLKIKKNELTTCQKEKEVQSCLKCEELLECKLRQEYVNAVYNSMNKGAGGGFEF
jgi:hypothetical protein